MKVKNVVPIPIPISASAQVTLSGEGTNEKIAYSPGQPILQTAFNTTEIGDTAKEEFYIVPRNRSEFSEDALLARVDDGGSRVCGGDEYRVVSTKYFYGPEATLGFSGIKTPALRAVYRCRAEYVNNSDIQNKNIIRELERPFEDAGFFDISESFIMEPMEVVDRLKENLERQSMTIDREERRDDGIAIVASNNGKIPEHAIIFVKPSASGSTIVTLKHMTYFEGRHERGTSGAGTARRGYSLGAKPVNRKIAYENSRRFIDSLLR